MLTPVVHEVPSRRMSAAAGTSATAGTSVAAAKAKI
jgi:hypothetical protein